MAAELVRSDHGSAKARAFVLRLGFTIEAESIEQPAPSWAWGDPNEEPPRILTHTECAETINQAEALFKKGKLQNFAFKTVRTAPDTLMTFFIVSWSTETTKQQAQGRLQPLLHDAGLDWMIEQLGKKTCTAFEAFDLFHAELFGLPTQPLAERVKLFKEDGASMTPGDIKRVLPEMKHLPDSVVEEKAQEWAKNGCLAEIINQGKDTKISAKPNQLQLLFDARGVDPAGQLAIEDAARADKSTAGPSASSSGDQLWDDEYVQEEARLLRLEPDAQVTERLEAFDSYALAVPAMAHEAEKLKEEALLLHSKVYSGGLSLTRREVEKDKSVVFIRRLATPFEVVAKPKMSDTRKIAWVLFRAEQDEESVEHTVNFYPAFRRIYRTLFEDTKRPDNTTRGCRTCFALFVQRQSPKFRLNEDRMLPMHVQLQISFDEERFKPRPFVKQPVEEKGLCQSCGDRKIDPELEYYCSHA